MNPFEHVQASAYLSALDERNTPLLRTLEQRMTTYYQTTPYHAEWIEGRNSHWSAATHPAQMEMVRHIPAASTLLEVGCGDGAAKVELERQVRGVRYTGIDLNEAAWRERTRFVGGRANALPFADATFDVVLSMYVVEHLVFPHHYLDEAWRVLKAGGTLLTIAPNFATKAMPSERIGLSYGSGREKVQQGQWADALLTTYDSRLRLPRFLNRRRAEMAQGKVSFPILESPRCLHLSGFIPDCDAVYPVLSEELSLYLQRLPDYGGSQGFYEDTNCFGLAIIKRDTARPPRADV